jgi:hypothetical protein
MIIFSTPKSLAIPVIDILYPDTVTPSHMIIFSTPNSLTMIDMFYPDIGTYDNILYSNSLAMIDILYPD